MASKALLITMPWSDYERESSQPSDLRHDLWLLYWQSYASFTIKS